MRVGGKLLGNNMPIIRICKYPLKTVFTILFTVCMEKQAKQPPKKATAHQNAMAFLVLYPQIRSL